jgi:hypothetical protein
MHFREHQLPLMKSLGYSVWPGWVRTWGDRRYGNRKKLLQCPYCPENTRFRRSRRKNLFERFVSLFGRLPYRCVECGHRFVVSRGKVRHKKLH